MKVLPEYYNITEKDLNDNEKNDIEELKEACRMQFPQLNARINQRTINAWIKKRLEGKNWTAEKKCPHGDRERFDFYKKSDRKSIFVEVEYGNRFSVDHDLLKFVKTYQCKKDCIFVLIVPGKNLKIGKSIATCEYACDLMKKCKCIEVPLIVLGIVKNNENDELNLDELNYKGLEKDKFMDQVRNAQPAIYFGDEKR